MNLNSQYSFYPLQPDNPSDQDRHFLSQYALSERGRPEDLNFIIKLLSPPPAITNYARPGEFKNLRVGIIGGGLAGMAAAFELRKLGFDITVYDALQDRIGGRVYTYYFDREKTLYHEFGAMRIPVTHETVWHYLKLFNLPTRPFIHYNPNGYVYLRKTRVRNDREGLNVMRYIYPKYCLNQWERNTSWQKIMGMGMDNHLLYAAPEERAEILQVKPCYSRRALLWSDNSNIRMMESAGLSQDAISLVSNFAPLLTQNLYRSYIDYIQESYPVDLSYLYEIPGGLVKLSEAFYDSFIAPDTSRYYGDIEPAQLGRVSFKPGCWVNGIYYDKFNKKVELKYRQLDTNDNLEEKFDYIICAIPFSTLRTMDIDPLFSGMKMRAIKEVNYTPSQKTLMLCRERFWEKDGIVGDSSITDLPIASIWYPSDHAKYINEPANAANQLKNLPVNEPGVIIGSYNFNLDTTRLTNQPDEMREREVKREVETVHGLPEGCLDRVVQDIKTLNWDQQPTFRGALSFFETEQKRIFSYCMAVPEYNNRVFFAGEHISAVHRWMQGALQSGMQAANDLAGACIEVDK
jgi:Monoamine oxidase